MASENFLLCVATAVDNVRTPAVKTIDILSSESEIFADITFFRRLINLESVAVGIFASSFFKTSLRVVTDYLA